MRKGIKAQRWVIKIGSQMVKTGGPVLIRSHMQQVAILKKKYNIEVIWVTSGAIATAVERTSFNKPKSGWKLPEKQALSAIGQPLLMDIYNISLHSIGLLGAQVLVSYRDLANAQCRRNFRDTIEQLLKWNVVPLINENDAVATEEIKFGDNDSLSAKVCAWTKSDRLVILTDVDGLYDKNPKTHKDANLITRLDHIPKSTLDKLKKESSKGVGTGGMHSKLRAAQESLKKRISTILIKGDEPNLLSQLASGQMVKGTYIGKNEF